MSEQILQVKAAGTAIETIDMGKDMTITVHANDGAKHYLDELTHGEGTIVYDLYKLADLQERQGNLSYQFKEKFQFLKKDFDGNAWDTVAQEAMIKTIGGEGTLVNEPANADYTGCVLGNKQQVDPGLYLLIARGTKEDSTIVTKVSTAASDFKAGSALTDGLATMTLLGINTFTVMPHLVCVPNKIAEDNVPASLNGSGKWVYDQDITLKMDADPATGSIEIEKTLVDFYGNAENATFVFQVDTFYPTEDKLFKSDVYAIQFTKAGTKKIRIDGLPLGAEIKIMEIYSGVNYTASIAAPDSLNVVVAADEVPVARFTNTYNGKKAGGGGVTNYFKYNVTDGAGEWSWEQKEDNTTTSNGIANKLLSQIKSLIEKAKGN